MSYRDYYSVLGLTRDATPEEIQRSYRQLAKKYHPDVSKEPRAEEHFQQISEAYEVLKDPDRRRLYDKYGPHWRAISEGRQPPPRPGDFQNDFGQYGFERDPSDLNHVFEQVFAGRRRRRRRRSSGSNQSVRPGDQETTVEIPVTTAYRGGPWEITVLDQASRQNRRLTVTVPPRIQNGQRIRLAGQSLSGGDLLLRIRLVSDGVFRVEGSDIFTKLRISPSEAVLGTTAPLPTLDGRVNLRVPPGSSTGKRIRLRERGYPIRGTARGDLYAEIQVLVPTDPSPEEKQLYEELARISRFDPRSDG